MMTFSTLIIPIVAVLIAYYLGTRASYIRLRYERQIDVLNEIRAQAHEINTFIRIIKDTDTAEPRDTEISEKLNDELMALMRFARKNRYWLRDEDWRIVEQVVDQAIGVGKHVLDDQGFGDWFSNLMFTNAKENAAKAGLDSQLARLDQQTEYLIRSGAFPRLTGFLLIFVNNLPGSHAVRERIKEYRRTSA